MRDYRTKLSQQLYDRLSNLEYTGVTSVYTVIPTDTTKPYVYIGDFEANYLDNKSDYRQLGSVNIIYYDGFDISYSLRDAFYNVDLIKQALKTSIDDVIDMSPLHSMVYWKMENDSSIYNTNNSERVYSHLLQYQFEISGIAEEPITEHEMFYIFDSRTGSVPASTKVIVSTTLVPAITYINISTLDSSSNSQRTYLELLGSGDILHFRNSLNPSTKYFTFNVSSVEDNTTYFKVNGTVDLYSHSNIKDIARDTDGVKIDLFY